MAVSLENERALPTTFIWRRLQSLAGLWLVLFLIEHLVTNSMSALAIGDDGKGFIAAVNSFQEFPYLRAIEILFLGLPFAIHMIWGTIYLFSAKYNSMTVSDAAPKLNHYARNHAYTWQRVTSYLLLIGVIAHVVQMRFIDYPDHQSIGSQNYYLVEVQADPGLQTVTERLGTHTWTAERVELLGQSLKVTSNDTRITPGLIESYQPYSDPLRHPEVENSPIDEAKMIQEWVADMNRFLVALQKHTCKPEMRVVVAPDFGTAELLVVRETFKSPLQMILYSLFVLAACFHAFNGLWTFLVSWGVAVTSRFFRGMARVSTVLTFLFSLLGLASIWLTYWVNLRH